MPSKELIEKVAQAIYASRDGSNITPWPDLNRDYQARLLSDAQAAISTILAEVSEHVDREIEGYKHVFGNQEHISRSHVLRALSELKRRLLAASALGEKAE
ncbi:hypothetical protein F9K85_09620 [Brucella tritici]|uniref:hypothetical protein n=1 Tax=Brucella tritici TaxID=94626 RepID=UPI00124C9A05|nr:hypothetical protein [Brucella tritici]KAB2676744.1 hypothetical protein F9K85_09620 [Brucella tritici]